MHRRGVVHRDIAPDNIILLPDGRLKLIDFGAARSYVGDKSMTVVVKKGFAPVEQYMRKGSNASTDVYALAATIYYCITGIVPPDSAERQYGEAVMTAPSALGAVLLPVQEYALEKALELQPKERIQTVAGLKEQLFSENTVTDAQKTDSERTGRASREKSPARKKHQKSESAKASELWQHQQNYSPSPLAYRQ
jgi:serine/threonine protein kinase